MMNIDVNDWFDNYKPISENGIPLEYEYDELPDYAINKIWTEVSGDNETVWILPGIKFVNRMCYYVTEIPWADKNITVDPNIYTTSAEIVEKIFEFLSIEPEVNLIEDPEEIELCSMVKKENIKKLYSHQEQYIVTEAKYIFINYLEILLQKDLSDCFYDLIHDIFSEL